MHDSEFREVFHDPQGVRSSGFTLPAGGQAIRPSNRCACRTGRTIR